MRRGGGKYEAAELELHSEYKKRRANGLKVNARWLKINMKRILSRTCGREVESNFKASNHWVVNFTRRFNMSFLRKNNKKNLSVEQSRQN